MRIAYSLASLLAVLTIGLVAHSFAAEQGATMAKIGDTASANALIPTAATAAAATQRCDRAASTIAPPGICPTKPTIAPAVKTRPISVWVHFSVVR